MRKAGKITMMIGGILLALGIAGLIAAFVLLVNGYSTFGDADPITNGSDTVELDEDHYYDLYSVEKRRPGDCTLYDPEGDSVTIDGKYDPDDIVELDGETWTFFGSFTTTDAGEYEFACDGNGDVRLGFGISGNKLVGVGLAGIATVLGFVVLIVGLIVWLVGRGKNSAPPYPGYPPAPMNAYGPGGWNQPPYGQGYPPPPAPYGPGQPYSEPYPTDYGEKPSYGGDAPRRPDYPGNPYA